MKRQRSQPFQGCLAPELEALATQVVDAAFTVHTRLGPGMLEHVYELCLAYELDSRGIRVRRQAPVSIYYGDLEVEDAYRVDLFVEDRIILELKSVEQLLPVHEAQLMTYLKLSGLQLGFLINFNVPAIMYGIKRIVR